MKDRIENLETLNERLADERFDMNYNWAETAYEKLAWHFFRTKPFDTDILYKGTCARFDEGIERPLTDEGVEEMKARYTHLFTADNQQLRQWLFSTPLENVAAYTARRSSMPLWGSTTLHRTSMPTIGTNGTIMSKRR